MPPAQHRQRPRNPRRRHRKLHPVPLLLHHAFHAVRHVRQLFRHPVFELLQQRPSLPIPSHAAKNTPTLPSPSSLQQSILGQPSRCFRLTAIPRHRCPPLNIPAHSRTAGTSRTPANTAGYATAPMASHLHHRYATTITGNPQHEPSPPGSPLRPPSNAPRPRLRAHRRPYPCPRHRCHHRPVQLRRRRPPPAARLPQQRTARRRLGAGTVP